MLRPLSPAPDASLNAIQPSSAHFTRAGYLATPANAMPSPSTSSSPRPCPRDEIISLNAATRLQRVADGLADHQVGEHRRRRLADRAALRRRRRRRRPCSPSSASATRSVTSSPQVGLTWYDLGAERLPQPAVVRVLVVIQDHFLVHLLQLHCSVHSEEVAAPPHAGHQPVDLVRACCTRRTTPARWRRCRTGGAAATRSGGPPAPRRPRRRAPARRRGRGRRRRRTPPAPPRSTRSRRPDDPDARRPRPARPAPRPTSSRSCAVDGVHPDLVEIVDGRGQPDDLRRHRRARLEPLRRRARRWCASIVHGLDHRAAGEERRHRVEQLAPPVQHADAGRARASCARRTPRSRRRARGSRPAGAAPTGRRRARVSAPTACARATSSRDRRTAP